MNNGYTVHTKENLVCCHIDSFSIVFVLIEEKSPVVKGQRHTWLPEENAAIERFFNSHIDDTSKPGNKGKLHGKVYM